MLPAARQGEDIVVTGTRIRGKSGGPNPVKTVSARELADLSPESLPAGLAKMTFFQPIKSSDSASDGGYQPTGTTSTCGDLARSARWFWRMVTACPDLL
jgi:hypothetical protein